MSASRLNVSKYMPQANWWGILAGVVPGIIGLALIGTLSVNPCSSMALVFDNARESPLYNAWLGFDCESWRTPMEGLLLEWLPAIIILAISGACSARLGETRSPRRGAITGGLVAGIAFVLRTLSVSFGYFQYIEPFQLLLFGTASIFVGLLVGWAAGLLVKRYSTALF